ncbi:VOC family protein [Pseudomonas sp. PDM03]|jgi:catechol 2,3-dioxygenase-like lactoylglutathione lyase family enzyme|uniref:VOC family protein n=1 Tax=unclassified Pseudomonas TaxID=196821 RepID=UPI00177E49A2|nr:VOC family protein [Pseudomonas sp. PDM03]MBD9588558.1 VOC family protein [Pseudomonas sp. PDM03]
MNNSLIVNFQLDHLVIAVKDLPRAIENYRQMGFNVVSGGRSEHAPTKNARVFFFDGSYLELIEWTAPAPGEKWYDRLTQYGEGYVGFALLPSDITRAISQAALAGIHCSGPVAGASIKYSDEQVQWHLSWPDIHALPFLCSDVTPRSLRVTEGHVRHHPNLALGIQSIAFRVAKLESSTRFYCGLLGTKAEQGPDELSLLESEGVVVRTFRFGGTELHLVTPVDSSGPGLGAWLSRELKTKGEGIYGLCIRGIRQGFSSESLSELSPGTTLRVASEDMSLLEQISPVAKSN